MRQKPDSTIFPVIGMTYKRKRGKYYNYGSACRTFENGEKEKMKKKVTSVFLAMLSALVLCACMSKEVPPAASNVTTAESTSTSAQQADAKSSEPSDITQVQSEGGQEKEQQDAPNCTRYDFPSEKVSISVPNDYNVYSLEIPYTDEMCRSQGVGPENMKAGLSAMDNNALIIPANDPYSEINYKIYLKVKDKKYENITLSELSKTDYETLASTIVSSFKVADYETVEGNGLRYFVFKYDRGTGNTCRYATILNGHMVYVYAVTGDTPITQEQQSVLEYIALSIKGDI